MSLQTWARRLGTEVGGGPWSDPPWIMVFRLRIAKLVVEVVDLTPVEWDGVARGASYHGRFVLWDRRLDLLERFAFLRDLSSLAVKVGHMAPSDSGGLFMFWDRLCSDTYAGPEMGGAVHSAESYAKDRRLRAAIYDVLKAQVLSPQASLQLSALHGLNHLSDSRTPILIHSLMSYFDPEVREFAAKCATGSLP